MKLLIGYRLTKGFFKDCGLCLIRSSKTFACFQLHPTVNGLLCRCELNQEFAVCWRLSQNGRTVTFVQHILIHTSRSMLCYLENQDLKYHRIFIRKTSCIAPSVLKTKMVCSGLFETPPGVTRTRIMMCLKLYCWIFCLPKSSSTRRSTHGIYHISWSCARRVISVRE
jgi:hypothetical protein